MMSTPSDPAAAEPLPGSFSTDVEPAAVRPRLIPAGATLAFCLLTSCFAAWGLANNMTDTLLAAFKKIMSMTDFQTSWIQLSFYGAYFCLALPAALFIRRFSYKSGVLLGLGLFAIGGLLFYPSSLTVYYENALATYLGIEGEGAHATMQMIQYGCFLASLYILAGGCSILETSSNSYVLTMGDTRTATQRLNLAQAFNPIGSISGIVISQFFILSQLQSFTAEERAAMPADQLHAVQLGELNAVMGPYVVVALVLVVLWIALASIKMPHTSGESVSKAAPPLGETFMRLIRNRKYVGGVVAQFFYVGAQIGVWSYTIRYVMLNLGLDEAGAATYYVASIIAFSLSRFVCTGLMSLLKPGMLLTLLAVLAMILTVCVMTLHGIQGVICLIGVSACMSLMFPTIFGIGAKDLGKDAQLGGAGMIMAILGGAVLTAVQGQISDRFGSIALSYSVPLFCFLVIALFGVISSRMADKA